tara:strand:- start:128 stop:325 length:198 start_codon:yes stop_codon:yes gene_type:complete
MGVFLLLIYHFLTHFPFVLNIVKEYKEFLFKNSWWWLQGDAGGLQADATGHLFMPITTHNTNICS